MADIDQTLDLSGEVCPYTFVKTKLALEQMEVGEVLQVTVDNGESAGNVPRSLELEGHEVLQLEKGDGSIWKITVRNAGFS